MACQETLQGGEKRAGLFDRGDVAAVVDNHGPRTWDLVSKVFSHFEWKNFVFAAPDHQSRYRDFLQLTIRDLLRNLVRTYGLLDDAVVHLRKGLIETVGQL